MTNGGARHRSAPYNGNNGNKRPEGAMNSTGICWADWSWNPIVGCDGPEDGAPPPSVPPPPASANDADEAGEGGRTATTGGGRCDYCYAYGLRGRIGEALDCDDCRSFTPHLHPERLEGSKAPAGVRRPGVVFADSMGDWWGPNVDPEWRKAAMQAMREAPWHSYVVLTKRPEMIGMPQISELAECAPPSLWLGVSVTGMDDIWRVEQLREIMRALPPEGREKIRAVVSVEPLLRTAGGWDPFQRGYQEIDWVICGALTGPGGEQPMWSDSEAVREWAERCGAAMWEKDNLNGQRTQTRPRAMREHLETATARQRRGEA